MMVDGGPHADVIVIRQSLSTLRQCTFPLLAAQPAESRSDQARILVYSNIVRNKTFLAEFDTFLTSESSPPYTSQAAMSSTTLNDLIGAVFLQASDPPPPPPHVDANDGRSASSSTSVAGATDAAVDTLALLSRAQRLADSIGVISTNDALRDISTSSLRTLFLPSLRAELETSVRTGVDRAARAGRLRTARTLARQFLAATLALAVVPPSTRTLLKHQLAAQDTAGLESLTSDDNNAATAAGVPPHTREIKIALFRLERALKSALDEFRTVYRAKLKHLTSARIPSDPYYDLLLVPRRSGADDDENDEESDDDDDNGGDGLNGAPGGITSVRQYLLALLNLHVVKAAALMQSTSQELDLLRTMPPTPPTGSTSSRDSVDSEWRLDSHGATSLTAAASGPLMGAQGKVLRPFTITPGAFSATAGKSRTDIANDVFRPSHRLPTMSIDEYLAEEQRRGNIIQGGGQASYDAPTSTEQRATRAQMDGTTDAHTADEEQRQHDIYWDSFTESNKRGAGNTMNRG